MNVFVNHRLLCAVVLCGLAIVGPAGTRAIGQESDSATAADHSVADHAHTAADAHGSEPNPLVINLDLAVWTGVIFVLLFLVLRTFAWPQITAALEERERKIADTLAAAQAKNEEAKRLLAEHEAKLAETAGEIREMLDEAKRDAEHTRKTIADKGREDAQAELTRVLREIDRAKDGAIQELAVASANTAIDLARNVVSTQLTSDQQNQLVREALGKLSASMPSKN